MPASRFRVHGVIREKETGRPLAELVVRAYDKDVVSDDYLGFATTDEDGRFRITFRTEDFRDVWEESPDVYLRIFDRQGQRELHSTRRAIRWNAGPDERYDVEVPAARLAGTRSGR